MTDYLAACNCPWDWKINGKPRINLGSNSRPNMINGVEAADNNQAADYLCTCMSCRRKTRSRSHFFFITRAYSAAAQFVQHICMETMCSGAHVCMARTTFLTYFIGFYATTGSANPHGLHNTVQRKFLGRHFKAFARWLRVNVCK